MQKVTVLGAGAWGTALAIHLAKAGHLVTLWAHSKTHAQQLKVQGENKRYLVNYTFPTNLTVSADFEKSVKKSTSILVVVPSSAFADVFQKIANCALPIDTHIAWATKGLEPKSKLLLHEVAQRYLPNNNSFSVVSGPTFAFEVAKGLPTAIVSASSNPKEAEHWASLLHYKNFRVYTQTDIAGVEIGGAYKNIIAIATGVSDGLGMGANAKAAIISRGMVEIIRFGTELGAKPETLMGLAGLGDLVLTCNDDLSRNRRFGLALARGNSLEQAQKEIGQVVEGVKAAKIIYQLAKEKNLDLPIAKQVYNLIMGKVSTKQAFKNLLSRSSKAEA